MTQQRTDHVAYEEILSEHKELQTLLEQVSTLLDDRPATIDTVVTLLNQLDEHVRRHFAHEEEGGYLHEVIADSPRFSERVQQLGEQHPALAAALAGLVQQARDCDGSNQSWEALAYRFESFFTRFLKHETRENTLIQEAFNTDIGTED